MIWIASRRCASGHVLAAFAYDGLSCSNSEGAEHLAFRFDQLRAAGLIGDRCYCCGAAPSTQVFQVSLAKDTSMKEARDKAEQMEKRQAEHAEAAATLLNRFKRSKYNQPIPPIDDK